MFFMAAGAALGAYASIRGSKSTNDALIEAYKQQLKTVYTNYNYNLQQLNMQEESIYRAAQAKMLDLEVNSMQNNSTVTAALSETGYEGRNKDKITQSITGQGYRQKTAVQDAAEVDVANVRSQKDSLYIQTRNQLNNLYNATDSQLIGGSQMFMGALAGAAQGAALGSVASVGFGALNTALGATGLTAGTAASAGASTAGATAASTAAGATGTIASNAATQVAHKSFAQAFTEAFSAGWDANSGLFTGLSGLSTSLNSFAPKRTYYNY